MGIDTRAAKAVVQTDRVDVTGEAQAPAGRTFGGRQVTESRLESPGLSAGSGQEEPASVGRVNAGTSIDARRVTATGSPDRGLEPEGVPIREPEPDSSVDLTELPWLGPGDVDEATKMSELLRALLNRRGITTAVRHDVARAEQFLRNVEGDALQADALLKRVRTELVSDVEWRELADRTASVRENISAFLDVWNDAVAPLLDGGTLGPSDAATVQGLRKRFDRARSYFYSDDMPWQDSARCIETRNPHGPPQPIVVHSRIVSGSALGTRLDEGYPAENCTSPNSPAWVRHVPGLAQTRLVDAGGEPLFSGVRHCLLQGCPLSDRDLAVIPAREFHGLVDATLLSELRRGTLNLDEMIGRHCSGPAGGEPDVLAEEPFPAEGFGEYRGRVRQQIVNGHARELAASDSFALSAKGWLHSATEVAAAALVADPASLQRALEGERVDLELFSIAVVTEGDRDAWRQQSNAFYLLEMMQRPRFHLVGPDRTLHKIEASISVREFFFSPGPVEVEGMSLEEQHGELSMLLGHAHAPEPGGAVAVRVQSLRQRALDLKRELVVAQSELARFEVGKPVGDSQVRARRSGLFRLNDEMRCLERGASTLEAAGKQLNALRAAGDGWSLSADLYKAGAARLALVAHLMGATPVLSCAHANDFTRELDAEIKFLATVAAHGKGRLPQIGENPELWQRARNDFPPQ